MFPFASPYFTSVPAPGGLGALHHLGHRLKQCPRLLYVFFWAEWPPPPPWTQWPPRSSCCYCRLAFSAFLKKTSSPKKTQTQGFFGKNSRNFFKNFAKKLPANWFVGIFPKIAEKASLCYRDISKICVLTHFAENQMLFRILPLKRELPFKLTQLNALLTSRHQKHGFLFEDFCFRDGPSSRYPNELKTTFLALAD